MRVPDKNLCGGFIAIPWVRPLLVKGRACVRHQRQLYVVQKGLDHNSIVEENLWLGHNDDVLVFKKNLQFTRVRAQRHELRQRLEINRAVCIRVCRNHLRCACA